MNQRLLFALFSLLLLCGYTPTVYAQTTAQSSYQFVEAAARAEAADASIIGVIGDGISPDDGTAASWLYLAQSDASESLFGLLRIESLITDPIDISELPAEITDMFAPGTLSAPWIDSDAAIAIAEAGGGAEFRATHDDANITAALIAVPAINIDGVELPPLSALWVVVYSSLSDDALAASIHVIEAQFGLPLDVTPTTARENLASADETGAAFADDATLVGVSSLFPDFSPEGKAAIWQYTYYSPAQDESRNVYAASGLAIAVVPTLAAPASTTELPEAWLDSPVAAAYSAELDPSNGLVLSPSLVHARLSRGLKSETPDAAYWQLNYALIADGFLEDLVEALLDGSDLDDVSLDGFSIESLLIPATEDDVVIVEPTPSAFTLIDAATDQPVDGFNPMNQDAVLDLALLPAGLNITAAFEGDVESVTFELNGTVVRTERVAPYALFGDINGNFIGGNLPVGIHELTAIPGNTAIAPQTVTFEIIDTMQPAVLGIVIVDAGTNRTVQELAPGSALSMSNLPEQLNIVALTNGMAGSVLLDLNDGFLQRLENVAPYAIFGDVSGDYLPGSLAAGGYTVTATPYSEPMAGGTAGIPFSTSFTVIGTASKGNMARGYSIEPILGMDEVKPDTYVLHENYPNPFNPATNISFTLPEAADVQLVVYDMLGREVETLAHGTFSAGIHAVSFDGANLPSGTYFYTLITPTGNIVNKMLLLK